MILTLLIILGISGYYINHILPDIKYNEVLLSILSYNSTSSPSTVNVLHTPQGNYPRIRGITTNNNINNKPLLSMSSTGLSQDIINTKINTDESLLSSSLLFRNRLYERYILSPYLRRLLEENHSHNHHKKDQQVVSKYIDTTTNNNHDINQKNTWLNLQPQSTLLSNNHPHYYWTSTILPSPERTTDVIQDRIHWFVNCLQISRYRTEEEILDFTPFTAQPLVNRLIQRNYYSLKFTAFTTFQDLDHLWKDYQTNDAPKQADWGFYKGPWIEDYWRYTFGRPIRRNISIVEWQYQVKRMGKESIKALSMPWDMIEVELVRSLSLPLQNEYLVLEEEFHKRVQGNDYNARQYVMDESLRKGLPFVEVEELFDYDLFYPYVPLFVPWERMAYSLFYGGTIAGKDANDDGRTLERMKSIQREMEHFLISKYNSAITYITVVQRAEGILMDNSRVLLPFLANMVTLNAGGGGDIPIPLLSGEQQLEDNIPAFGQHLHWISFVGAIREGIRSEIVQLTNYCYGQKLDKEFSKFRHRYFNIIKSDKFGEYTILEPNDYPERNYSSTSRSKEMRFRTPWIEMMSYSMLQLAPRGTNPTSFRLYEALQMGLIPVYVYDKERPWLPYYRGSTDQGFVRYPSSITSPWQLWDRIGFIVHIDDYDTFLDLLPELAKYSTWYNTMRQSIAEVRDFYFTYEGVIRQIYRMLLNPRLSDLTCSLPAQLYF